MNLNAPSFTPAYSRLYRELAAKISSGHWKPGGQLPTERQLAQDTKLSVGTVRKAMELLVTGGYCYRVQGKGTFVSEFASGYAKFFYKCRRSLGSADADILPRSPLVEEVPLPEEAARYLACPVGSRGLKVCRAFLGRDNSGVFPLAWCASYFAYARAAALLSTPLDDFVKFPLYTLLERDCHISTVYCDEFLQIATEIPQPVQTALNRPRHTLCFETRMLSYAFEPVPFEFRLSYVLGEHTGMMRKHNFRQ